ncbi:MAG: TetR/AcrR family transcriptional regulator [Lachnospiraceae bacterium]
MKQIEKTKLTKEKILAVAIDEFGTNGYAPASINNVCNAGISKGLIYHHFKNKDTLYVACLEVCMNELVHALNAVIDQKNFDLYVKTRLSFFEEQKNKGNMLLEAFISPPELHRETIQRIRKPYDALNQRAFEQILEEHDLREDVQKESATEYFLLMQTMFNWYFTNPAMQTHSPENVRKLHEDALPKMIDFMLHGILKEDEKI